MEKCRRKYKDWLRSSSANAKPSLLQTSLLPPRNVSVSVADLQYALTSILHPACAPALYRPAPCCITLAVELFRRIKRPCLALFEPHTASPRHRAERITFTTSGRVRPIGAHCSTTLLPPLILLLLIFVPLVARYTHLTYGLIRAMNALNILSGLSSTPPPSPARSRTSSSANIHNPGRSSRDDGRRSNETFGVVATPEKLANGSGDGFGGAEHDQAIAADEKTPLLQQQKPDSFAEKQSSHWRLPKQIAHTIVSSLKMALSAIAAPARLVVACFYDEQGTFSTLAPIRRLNRAFSKKKRRPIAYTVESSEGVAEKEAHREKPRLRPKGDSSDDLKREESPQRSFSVDSNASTVLPSDSETEKPTSPVPDDGPARHTRSKSASSRAGDEIAPAKKSIRIKLHSQESLLRQKRQVMGNRERPASNGNTDEDKVAAVASSLKSPSSPAVTKLKYPRAPAPPRPLVPRRQNSYTMAANGEVPKKTLIIDLDETLIHSMAKGGRMSTGHMVEVKLQGPVGGNGMFVGPQVPILYYVHERPHCHEFLRKVCIRTVSLAHGEELTQQSFTRSANGTI